MSNILIIDDSMDLRTVLAMSLQKAGHHVLESGDGEDGIRLAEEKHPDLVLLDVMMPKLDGWQVCHRLKNNPLTETIPVILLTSMDQKMDELRGYESGADAYVFKPWNLEQLLMSIDTLVTNRKASPRA